MKSLFKKKATNYLDIAHNNLSLNDARHAISNVLMASGRSNKPISYVEKPTAHQGIDVELQFSDGARYTASRYGDPHARTVVLSLHGFIPFRRVYHRQYDDAEAMQHMQHWTLDVIPHIDHRDPYYEKYSVENYDEQTRRYLLGFIHWLRQHTGVEKIILEGISKGGYDALSYAALFPEHVAKMILISPSGLQESMSGSFEMKDVLSVIRGVDTAIERMAPKAVGLDAADISSETMGYIKSGIKSSVQHFKSTLHLKDVLGKLDPQITRRWIQAVVTSKLPVALAGTENDEITPWHTFVAYKDGLGIAENDTLFLKEGGHAMIIGEKTYRQYNAWRLAQILNTAI